MKQFKVEVNAGHGGKDPGAIGIEGLKEKNIALSVALKIGKILEDNNIKVSYTRTTDIFVELHEIASRANKRGVDRLVSIHCNAFKDSNAQGVEVYHYPTSLKGFELSKSILDNIIKDKLYTKNRGVKMNDFAILRRSKMPATLVELGFITNVDDAKILKNKQDELAVAIAKGILSDLKVHYNVATEKDDVYADAIKVLVEHNIVGSPGAWEDAGKIKPESARSLVIKMADYITLKR